MKIFKTVEIPSKKIEIIDKELCNKCDKEIKNCCFFNNQKSWFNVEINKYNKDSSPTSLKYKMDLCEKCSLELLENLKSLGYKIETQKTGY